MAPAVPNLDYLTVKTWINKMGYHKYIIPKGKLGEFSKIEEEFLEAKDGLSQDNPVMVLIELSDMIGAVESYCKKHHNISLEQLINMTKATQNAFADGTRKNIEDEY